MKPLKPHLCLSLLALASSALLGCQTGSTVADPALLPQPVAMPQSALAGLRLTLQSTEGLPAYKCSIRLEYAPRYYYSSEPIRVVTRDFAPGANLTLDQLEPGIATLTLVLRDPQTDALLASETQGVSLAPGVVTQVALETAIGGTSGIDLLLSYTEQQKDFRYLHEADGLDSYFRGYYAPYRSQLYWLETSDGLTVPVTITSDRVSVGAGQTTYLGNLGGYGLPAHAQYVDSTPLGQYDRMRHYRWDNDYLLPGETNRKTLTVDRWLSPSVGLVKETLTDTNGILRTLRRDGLTQ